MLFYPAVVHPLGGTRGNVRGAGRAEKPGSDGMAGRAGLGWQPGSTEKVARRGHGKETALRPPSGPVTGNRVRHSSVAASCPQ